MIYKEISYIEKIEQLQSHFKYSTKLSEALDVSRRTLLNWRDKPESISVERRLDIDVLFCRVFIIPAWDKPKQTFEPVLLPDDLSHNEAFLLPFLRNISYGTLEIETDIARADFDKIIDDRKLPRGIDRKTFLEGLNAYLAHKRIWETVVERGEPIAITEAMIKNLHVGFMQGVTEQTGLYSENYRVMGKLTGVDTTLPEDIPEEMNLWVYKYSVTADMAAIAKAHVHFIAIHPFGDGNGRVGRALIMIQCLNAGLMPPLFNGENRAMYYAAMEHAMRHGRHTPLIRLFTEAAVVALV